LASSFGYGFVTTMGNLHSRMKAGKTVISLPQDSLPLTPALLHNDSVDTIVCATSDGYLLAFPLSELPELSKGKGNKLINIPPKRLKAGEEFVVGLTVMAEKQEILVCAGQRYLRMSAKDIEHFRGDRAHRGRKLPRGFQRVSKIELG
jgi:topoisomerase-4 subunit A